MWVLKNWCFWTVVLEKTLESPLDCQSILKEISPEYSLEELMLKFQYFGHLMQRTDSLEKDPDAGKYWRQMEKGTSEDEMVGSHHQLSGHDFEQTPGDGEGERSLACCSPWDHKELDMTEWLNNNAWRKSLILPSFLKFEEIFIENFWGRYYLNIILV